MFRASVPLLWRGPYPATLLAGVVALLIAYGGVATATPLDPKGQDWEGYSQLVQMARDELGPTHAPAAVVVLTPATLDYHKLDRTDGVVIIHPENALDVDELSAFMRAGGRIVLLDDYGTGDALLARFGIRRVPLPQRPLAMLRGNPALAIAEGASAHATVRDIGRVVTNHATGLEHKALSPVLVVRGDGEPDVLVGVAGAVGQGRLMAIGDSSVLMNSMLRYPGNHALATSVIRYSLEDDVWGKRGGKLYIVANDFGQTGSYQGGGADESQLDDARRAFEEAVETLRHGGMPPLAAYLLALAVGLGVIVWTSVRAGRTHRSATPRFMRPVPGVAQGGVAGHAAVLAAPGTRRALALVEMKSALEEDLTMRLGLDRVPSAEELAAKAHAAGLLDEQQSRSLVRVLGTLARVEISLQTLQASAQGGAWPVGGMASGRVRDADVFAIAARVRELREAVMVHSNQQP
ncbi:MAG TPA: DUF4350 domain-containing protein [Polyangiaceae bacterium]